MWKMLSRLHYHYSTALTVFLFVTDIELLRFALQVITVDDI